MNIYIIDNNANQAEKLGKALAGGNYDFTTIVYSEKNSKEIVVEKEVEKEDAKLRITIPVSTGSKQICCALEYKNGEVLFKDVIFLIDFQLCDFIHKALQQSIAFLNKIKTIFSAEGEEFIFKNNVIFYSTATSRDERRDIDDLLSEYKIEETFAVPMYGNNDTDADMEWDGKLETIKERIVCCAVKKGG